MRRKSIILPKIYRPSGRFNPTGWFVFFSVYDDIRAKMVRFKRKKGFLTCTTQQECENNAQRLKRKYTNRLRKGWSPFEQKDVIWEDSLAYQVISSKMKPIKRSRKNIPYFMSKFLASKKDSIAHGSYKKYQSELRIFKKWLTWEKISDIDISFFETMHANDFLKYLHDDRHLSGKTKNFYLINLANVWDYAKKERKMLVNIWSGIQKFKEFTKPQRPISVPAVQIIKNYLIKHDPQIWLAAQFMYYCFIRPKELRFLQIKHLELFEGKITLNADITKGGKSRIVDVDIHFLQKLFDDYKLHQYPSEYYVFSTKCEPFTKPVGKNYFYNHFCAARKALNLPVDFQFYGFKHTGAVAALKNGANIKDIQHQMGHSSLAITDEYLKNRVGYESEFFKKQMPGI